MELKEFISNTLIDIIDGINDAQKELRNRTGDNKVSATIIPKLPNSYSTSSALYSNGECTSVVDFDIAVTISAGTTTSGSLGVGGKIIVVEAKTTGQSQNSKESESRIKFQIPVKLPAE